MISVIRSGMDAAIQKLDVTSNNIANARTTGFKRREATFEDMYSTAIRTATGDRIGIGVRSPEIRMIQTQGNLQMTDDVLDLAVEGEGMFTLLNELKPTSPFYTRDGSFSVNLDGTIVNREGYSLLSSENQPIKIPLISTGILTASGFQEFKQEKKLTAVSVLKNGNIEATYGGTNIVSVGKVGLSKFSDPNRLKPIGSNLFLSSLASGTGVIGEPTVNGLGKIHSGSLEMANTDITQELSNMIKAQQAFSGASRLLQSEAEMVKKLI